MRYFITLSLFLLFACQAPDQTQESITKSYPEDLHQVLQAHGGLEVWRKMQGLYYEIVKESGNEKHFIQLRDRRDRVEGPNFTMGFDGNDVWMDADTTYKGNPEFYHNLMFYFYAMPFVLADDGINYETVEPLEFEGVGYPGIGISYDQGVGTSSKDEYFIYYDPITYKMAWLGYTVTYFSQETSTDVHWIRYPEWSDFNGVLLPVALTWYKYEDGNPTEPGNRTEFVNVEISGEPLPDELFEKP